MVRNHCRNHWAWVCVFRERVKGRSGELERARWGDLEGSGGELRCAPTEWLSNTRPKVRGALVNALGPRMRTEAGACYC